MTTQKDEYLEGIMKHKTPEYLLHSERVSPTQNVPHRVIEFLKVWLAEGTSEGTVEWLEENNLLDRAALKKFFTNLAREERIIASGEFNPEASATAKEAEDMVKLL